MGSPERAAVLRRGQLGKLYRALVSIKSCFAPASLRGTQTSSALLAGDFSQSSLLVGDCSQL